jgi:hypothetical protein
MITRRLLLAGAAGGFLSTRTASATTSELAFQDLYEREDELSRTVLGLAGEEVEMVGYMAPPLKAEADFFVLTQVPMSVCPFCETEAQWPANIVLVLTEEVITAQPYNRPIRVRGRLETGFERDAETGFVSLLRLSGASFERI